MEAHHFLSSRRDLFGFILYASPHILTCYYTHHPNLTNVVNSFIAIFVTPAPTRVMHMYIRTTPTTSRRSRKSRDRGCLCNLFLGGTRIAGDI
jgi:hypothetical protein